MAKLRFKKPKSEYTETYETTLSPIWCALFGPFYWMFRRNWLHVLVSFIAGLFTYGLSNIIYAFFANRINFNWYDFNGWEQVTDYQAVKKASQIKTESETPWRPKFGIRTMMFIFIAAVIVVVIKQQFAPVSGGGSTLYNMTQGAE